MEVAITGKNDFPIEDPTYHTQNVGKIETEKSQNIFQSLESFEMFVRLKFGDLLVCMPVITHGGERFITIYHRTRTGKNSSGIGCGMKYLPLFYVIGTIDEHLELHLKLITFHGKIIDEHAVNAVKLDDDLHLIEFIQQLNKIRLCEGIKITEDQTQHSFQTFSHLYLIEQLENNVIIRSRNCTFSVSEKESDSICEKCAALSSLKPKKILKETRKRRKLRKSYNQDNFTIFNDDKNNVYPSQYEDNHGHFKPEMNVSILKNENTEYELPPDDYHNEYNYDGGGEAYASQNDSTFEYNDADLDDEWSPELGELRQQSDKVFNQSENDELSFENKADANVSVIHRKTKQRTFKCKYCVHKTSDKPELLRHIQEAHDPEKPYSCDSCLFKTKEKRTLVQHIVAVHDKSKSYLCEQCSYATPSKGRLSCHIKAVHDKVLLRNYECLLLVNNLFTLHFKNYIDYYLNQLIINDVL